MGITKGAFRDGTHLQLQQETCQDTHKYTDAHSLPTAFEKIKNARTQALTLNYKTKLDAFPGGIMHPIVCLSMVI